MKRNFKTKAFTLAEVAIVLVLIGIIGLLYSAGVKLYNPTQKGFDVQGQRVLEDIDQVFNLIFAKHSESFVLTDLNDENGNFSITDNDAAPRFAAFFKEFLNTLELQDKDIAKVKEYYASEIVDYNRTSTGIKLNSKYSNFMNSASGTIFGFRLYKSCSANEKNANPPLEKSRRTVKNICGSIFYDVNNYRGPNKLGSDQYIIPFDINGSEIKKQ